MNIQPFHLVYRRPLPIARVDSPPRSKFTQLGRLISIMLALFSASFANAGYDDYDYIDIGAPLKELMQNNFSANQNGASINRDGDVIFYLRDNTNSLIDIYRYRSASDSLQAQGVTLPEGNYFYPRTFDLNDNGLIIFGQGQQSPGQLMVNALTPAGVLETRMILPSSNTNMPFNINNHDQMVARSYSEMHSHHLLISDGPDTRTLRLRFDPYTQTLVHIQPVTGESGDVVFGHRMRSGEIEFNWYNLSTDQLYTWVEPDIGGVFGIDINDAGLAVVTAHNGDFNTGAIYLQKRGQSVPILQTDAEYKLFRNPAKINSHNQVLVATYTQTSQDKLMIVEPQVSTNGEILGPPQNEPQLVFENGDGVYPLTNEGRIILRAILDTNNDNKMDFNDRGEVVFKGYVCDPSTHQDCYISTILARPKHLSPTNLAPTAYAGLDLSIRAGDSVQLDGSGSFDDNTPTNLLGFAWTVALVPEGSVVTEVGGSQTAHPTLTTDLPGVYKIRLQVSDEQGLTSDYDEVVVSTDNLAPTANAGPNALVLVDTQVVLDGQASSDPESDPLNYQWQWISTPPGSGAMLNGAETVMASFIADEEGDYVVRLTVSDPLGAGLPDRTTITAIRAEEFAKMEVMQANELVVALDPELVTTGGNQQALSNFMRQVNAALNVGDTEEAIAKLHSVIRRVDGCTLRGEPDGQGKERDWITDCEVQNEVYVGLDAALQALQQAQ